MRNKPAYSFSTEQEQRTCRNCSAPFTVTVAYLEGRKLPAAVECEACCEAKDPSPTVDPLDRAKRITELLETAGVNIRKHGGCTLDNWDAADSNTPIVAARDFLREMQAAAWSDAVRGLYLTGDTGTGKTHLAVATMREALLSPRVDPSRVVFDRAARLITEIQDTYGSGGTEKVLEKRERAHLWVLDDLGAEKATEDVLRILTDLFSAREGHPTVITSNLPPDGISGRWAGEGWARLASRLASQNFRAIRVKGRDRRFAA